MNLKNIVILLTLCSTWLIASCSDRVNPTSNAEQCLESQELYFNDPDSISLSAILGSRDEDNKVTSDGFWIRFKGKNAYGAFVQKNMYCSSNGSNGWARDKVVEGIALLTVKNRLLDANIKIRKDNMGKDKSVLESYGYLSEFELELKTESIVFDLPGNLN